MARVVRCVRCGRAVSPDEDLDGVDPVCLMCEDEDDYDADELGLDPEEDYDAGPTA